MEARKRIKKRKKIIVSLSLSISFAARLSGVKIDCRFAGFSRSLAACISVLEIENRALRRRLDGPYLAMLLLPPDARALDLEDVKSSLAEHSE